MLIPEYAILSVLQGLRDKLIDQTLWTEPFLVDGVPAQVLEDFQKLFSARENAGDPLRVGFIYPQSDMDLPSVTLAPESWNTSEAVLGELGFMVARQVFAVVDEVLVLAALGGETLFQLDHPDDVELSEVVKKNSVVLERTTHYTFDRATGEVTLVSPLALNDKLTISYSYYGENPIQVLGEISRMQTRLFIHTQHPESTLILTSLVWRELTIHREDMEENGGLKNLAISTEPFSPWDEILPAVGWKRDVVLSYEIEQVAGVRQPALPKVSQATIDISQAGTPVVAGAVIRLGIGS